MQSLDPAQNTVSPQSISPCSTSLTSKAKHFLHKSFYKKKTFVIAFVAIFVKLNLKFKNKMRNFKFRYKIQQATKIQIHQHHSIHPSIHSALLCVALLCKQKKKRIQEQGSRVYQSNQPAVVPSVSVAVEYNSLVLKCK